MDVTENQICTDESSLKTKIMIYKFRKSNKSYVGIFFLNIAFKCMDHDMFLPSIFHIILLRESVMTSGYLLKGIASLLMVYRDYLRKYDKNHKNIVLEHLF